MYETAIKLSISPLETSVAGNLVEREALQNGLRDLLVFDLYDVKMLSRYRRYDKKGACCKIHCTRVGICFFAKHSCIMRDERVGALP